MRELFFFINRCGYHISIPFILITFCIICLFPGNVMADIPSSERDALIALYNSTNGDDWTDNTNWNGPAGTEDTWYGVTVESDHVTQINLSDNNLDGTIPSAIGDLTSLTTLSLAGNILEGSLPTSLTNLTGLTTLLIDYNALYTNSGSLQTFLNGINPAWDDHQTIAPDNVSLSDACFGTSATLTWTPVSYTGDDGGYEVRYGTTSGALNSISVITGKSTASTTIPGLSPDTMYYFAVSSYTDAHPPENSNDVFSGLSREVSGGLCYDVTFSPNNGSYGSITGDTSQTIEPGEDCATVTAEPNTGDGYHFVNWTGTGGFETTTDNPLDVTNVTSDMTITANFELNEYEVTFSPDNAAHGSITGDTNQTITHGDDCTQVEAVANEDDGYRFSFWDGVPLEIERENPLTIVNVTSGMVITANFTLKDYDVFFIPGDNGSITGETRQDIDHGSNCTEVTAIPDTGYHFVGWTGDYTGTDNPLTITNVTEDLDITAIFEINVYTLTFSPGDHGGLRLPDDSNLVPHGASYGPVIAYPAEGYQFAGWTGDYAGDDNPLTLENVTSNMTITATYVLAFDGNGDGIPDAAQDHVKNLTAENSETVTVEFPDTATVLACEMVDDPSPDDRPAQYDFEYGFLKFTVDDVDTGGATTVVIYLPDGASPVTYFKYGRTLRTPTPHWYEFMYNGTTGAEIDGNIITLHFVDGERGDGDLSANGKIEDDGGPGFSDIITPQDDDEPGDSDGASGGCFIDAASSVSSFSLHRDMAIIIFICLITGFRRFRKTIIPEK